MVATEMPSVSVFPRGHRRPGSDPVRTVVHVRGEHDIATRVHLSATIARAAQLDGADIIVDLSDVTFMDASTIGALVVARSSLRAHSRSLSVRAPSPQARRLLDLCGLAGLIDESPASLLASAAPALGSWVDVPAGSRSTDAARPPPSNEPARNARRPGGAAAAIDQSRSPH